MGHIFISYSKKDIVYAEKLMNRLRREGFNPWVDMDGLGAGTYWQDRLQKQIQTCDAYILVMSHNARHSKWVPDELVARSGETARSDRLRAQPAGKEQSGPQRASELPTPGREIASQDHEPDSWESVPFDQRGGCGGKRAG